MLRLPLAISIAALAIATVSAASPSLRGIAPAKLAHYHPTADADADAHAEPRWTCLDGSKTIAWTAINDDYCDCADGSDEPGTSACANTTFYCANVGHIPANILSSRVDDGICDAECCDGSDETGAQIQCANVCESVGKQHRKKLVEMENMRRAGGKMREKYIAQASKHRLKLEAEIVRLQREVDVARDTETRLKRELVEAQRLDRDMVEAKRNTRLYAKLDERRKAVSALMQTNARLNKQLNVLIELLDGLVNAYNPNYQDMAVKHAVVAYTKWRDASTTTDDAVWTNTKLEGLVSEDPLDIMDTGLPNPTAHANHHSTLPDSDGGLLFRIHEYLPDVVVPYFEAMVDTLLDVLLKTNVITSVQRMRPKTPPPNPTRTPESESESTSTTHLAHLTTSLSTKQSQLAHFTSRYGRHAEFHPLENKCVSHEAGGYTYEVCLLSRITQIAKEGGASILLGTFVGFNPKGDREEAEDEFWMEQMYANGQRCWNGPERGVVVKLGCGVEERVVEVVEREKCKYSVSVVTPAVCFPTETEQQQQSQSQSQSQSQKEKEKEKEEEEVVVVKDEL